MGPPVSVQHVNRQLLARQTTSSPWNPFSAAVDLEFRNETESHSGTQDHRSAGFFCVPGLPHLALLGAFVLDDRQALGVFEKLPDSVSGKCQDAYLILHGYARWGLRLPEHLSGRFAFVIRDSRRGHVFGCVDHMGTLPLLYRRAEASLVVAGDMKTMLQTANCPRELNLVALPSLADFDSLPEFPGTCLHKGICAVPPGHYLLANLSGIRFHRYWQPSLKPELVPAKEDEIFSHARHLVQKSVASHLEGRDRAVIMFSGGLDSSALVVTAAALLRKQGKRLLALCAVNDPAHSYVPDERQYMQKLSGIDNLDLEYVDSAGKGPFDGLEDPGLFETTPRLPILRYLFDSIFSVASSHGAEVLLHGGGGESGISGTPSARFLELATRFRWSALRRELRTTAEVHQGSAFRLLAGEIRRYYSRTANDSAFFLTPEAAWAPCRQKRRYPPLWPDSAEAQLRALANTSDRCSVFATQPPEFVFGYSQPLLNKELLEYCLAVPARLKSQNGYGRFLIRKAFAPVLPADLVWRKAQMWGSSDYNWRYNRQIRGVLEFVKAIRKSDPVREIVDVPRLERALQPIGQLWQSEGRPKVHLAAISSVPATISLINFLRQFPGFRD